MIEYKDRLLEAMEEAQITVAGLAKEMGLSYQAVKKVVDGATTSFTAVNNSRAAEILDRNSNWLATGKGEKKHVERAPSWTPASEPEYLNVVINDLEAADPVPGYTQEALALAWLLDQVKDKLDKKKAETEASAVILRYVNKTGEAPTGKPTGR